MIDCTLPRPVRTAHHKAEGAVILFALIVLLGYLGTAAGVLLAQHVVFGG